jgi:SmpA / OmlA family
MRDSVRLIETAGRGDELGGRFVACWMRALAVATIVLLAAWGCGGDDQGAEMARSGSEATTGARPDPVPTSDPREDERQIRQLTDRFYDAFLAGDGETACSLLSEAGERQVVEDPDNAGYGGSCAAKLAAGAAIIKGFYGPDPEISLTEVKVTGDRATGTSIFAGEAQGVTFEREDGEWKFGPEPEDSESSGGVDRETADSWPERWCDVQLGMTRSQVQQIMGRPTATHTGELSQDEYDAYQWSFTAFYRYRTDIEDPADEPAYQLQAYETALTAADRARIKCALTRG